MKKLPITQITFKREHLLLPVNGIDEVWDYLTIYDSDGKVLTRSHNAHAESTIILEYNGLTFIAPPGATTEENIYITVQSLKQFIL